MSVSRRLILKSAGALPVLAGSFGVPAFAQTAPAAPAPADMPPVLFVHGNGDHAALWITTMWRMESNGVPREKMFAINFTNPLARIDDTVEQADRSSTEDQRRELAEAIKEFKSRTGASRRGPTRTRNGNKPFIQRTSLAHDVEIALWKLGGVTTASEET